MKKQEVRYFCDRCGEECTESVKNNGQSIFFRWCIRESQRTIWALCTSFQRKCVSWVIYERFKGENLSHCVSHALLACKHGLKGRGDKK